MITARVVRAVEVCNLGASYPVAHQLLALGGARFDSRGRATVLEFDVTGLVSTPDRKEREGKDEAESSSVPWGALVPFASTCTNEKIRSKMSLRLNR